MICPVGGCDREIPDTKIMCPPHWSAVPRNLKRHIWVLYETGFGKRDALPWQSAVKDAIQAIR